MIIGYVRVSTVEQHEDRQLVTMEKYKVEKIFQEKVSAKDTNRPELQAMLEFAREGATCQGSQRLLASEERLELGSAKCSGV